MHISNDNIKYWKSLDFKDRKLSIFLHVLFELNRKRSGSIHDSTGEKWLENIFETIEFMKSYYGQFYPNREALEESLRSGEFTWVGYVVLALQDMESGKFVIHDNGNIDYEV